MAGIVSRVAQSKEEAARFRQQEPRVRIPHAPHAGGEFPSLVRELRPHLPWGGLNKRGINKNRMPVKFELQINTTNVFTSSLCPVSPIPHRSPFLIPSLLRFRDLPGDDQLLSLHLHACFWLQGPFLSLLKTWIFGSFMNWPVRQGLDVYLHATRGLNKGQAGHVIPAEFGSLSDFLG